jgi:hypothetical protein
MSTNQPADSPLPPADAADGPPSPGRGGQLIPSQHNLPESSLVNDATPSPAPESISNAKLAESQPMTASSSSSSHLTMQDPSHSLIAAATYGTRSRNRNGGSRPNYAEDQDKDLDFELTATPKNSASKRAVSSSDDALPPFAPTRDSRVPHTSAERAFLKNGSKEGKDGLPGMSSFSANPTSNGTHASIASKKRKQPGSSLTNGLPVPTSHQKSTRRASHAGGHGGASDTNMMSFDSCQGQLVDGKLKADDGTVLSVNGMNFLQNSP